MIGFLVKRPIGSTMIFIALVALGLVASGRLPISLMPDIDVPEVTVQARYANYSASQMEQNVLNPLRSSLRQTLRLTDIRSEARNGQGVIRLRFEYGTNVSLAAVEVNEKVDQVVDRLPDDMRRPTVIKASAVDLPVFTVNVTLQDGGQDPTRFLELSEFVEMVIKRRIEQIPEVAMVDISGLNAPEIRIQLDTNKVNQLNLSFSEIASLITENNRSIGNIILKEGFYQYNVKMGNQLVTARDLEELTFKKAGQVFRLGQVATIRTMPQTITGLYQANGQRAIALEVIKQSDARLADMGVAVKETIDLLRTDYPDLSFEITRDQSSLLVNTIGSLKGSLILGSSLAFLVMFVFIRDIRAPFLIGLSIPVSVVISLLGFQLIGITINIISLSGLLLGVGMMIDNSIIVIDNITQQLERGKSLVEACTDGAGEVFRPLLSSVLTTCAVFIPLIFLSGLSGALFYDQAVAVTIGLMASLGVSITLIPVYFNLVYRHPKIARLNERLMKGKGLPLKGLYRKGHHWTMKHQGLMIVLMVVILGGSVPVYWLIEKQQFPEVTQVATQVPVDWNENIHVEENQRRIRELEELVQDEAVQTNAFVGEQQFILTSGLRTDASNEALLYVETPSVEALDKAREKMRQYLREAYPRAVFDFQAPETAFSNLFRNAEPPLVARVYLSGRQYETRDELTYLLPFQETLRSAFPEAQPLPTEEVIDIYLDHAQLTLYDVDPGRVVDRIRTILNENTIGELRSFQRLTAIKAAGEGKAFFQQLETDRIRNQEGQMIPLKYLISSAPARGLKTVHAAKDGEYYPFAFEINSDQLEGYMQQLTSLIDRFEGFEVQFEGSLLKSEELIRELLFVMVIALTLLYFILAAQFESVWQPLIILLEVPMNFLACFAGLYLTGTTLNIMSLIGIVVMSGVVVNDSILKVDTINQLRKVEGLSVDEAIAEGGERRLKPILMTSITTILALVPFLIAGDLGSELQRPLAITVICGMLSGTLVSLFYVPLFYRWVVRK